MAKILAPNTKFNGKRAGIAFVDGVGESDDSGVIRYFSKHGYKVDGQSKDGGKRATSVKDEATDPLAGLTVEQLREHAAVNGIDLGDARTKAELRDAIKAATPVADSPQD